jgi:TonB family protein
MPGMHRPPFLRDSERMHDLSPTNTMKRPHLLRCWKPLPMRSTKASLILACIVGASAAHATITSTPHFASAQSMACTYGLSADDLKSAGAAVEQAPRPNAIVRAWVDERGKIGDAIVEVSSGNPAFDNLALQASRRAQCRPFVGVDSKPVAVETNFVFNLPHASVAAAAAINTDSPPLPSLPAAATGPSLLSTALPFQPGKPLDAADLANRFGIPADSSKAKLLAEWTQKLRKVCKTSFQSADLLPLGEHQL